MKSTANHLSVAAFLYVCCTLTATASPSLNLPMASAGENAQAHGSATGNVVAQKVSVPTPPPLAVTTTPTPASKASAAPATAVQPASGTSTVAAAATTPQPGVDRAPTLGDWEDLAQRKAYKAEMDKLTADPAKNQPQTPAMGLPPLPPSMSQATPVAEPKKRPHFSDACPDDDKPCFFSVYGLSVDGGGNNFHGQFAINGRAWPVYKGKKFDGYTVTDISDSALTAVDKYGTKHVWPLYTAGDFAADPEQIGNKRQETSQATPMFPIPAPLPNVR